MSFEATACAVTAMIKSSYKPRKTSHYSGQKTTLLSLVRALLPALVSPTQGTSQSQRVVIS